MSRIALLRLQKLGDIVLSTALLDALITAHPKNDYVLITKEEYAELEDLLPQGINILTLKRPYKTKAIMGLAEDVSELEIETLLDLQGNPSSFLISIFSGIKKVYRYRKDALNRHLNIKPLSRLSTPHTIKKYLIAAEKAWLLPRDTNIIPPRLYPLTDLSILKNGNCIAIIIGAGRFTKRWISSYYIRLSRMLIAAGKTPVFIGGIEDKKTLEILDKEGAEGIIMPPMGIRKISQVLSEADLILGNDCGLTHLAWALDKTILMLAGGTHRNLGFFPFGNKVTILEENLPCRPCSLHGLHYCKKKHFNCMKLLTPERVFATLLALWPKNTSGVQ